MHLFAIIATIAIRGVFHYYRSFRRLIQIGADLLQVGVQQLLMNYLRKTNGLFEFG